MPLPKKLKKDGLLDVACEIRFSSSDDPEVIVGKIASLPFLKGHEKQRTGLADIPASLRQQDPNLKHQHLMLFNDKEALTQFKVGTNSIVYSARGQYRGWAVVFDEMQKYFNSAIESLESPHFTRIGLRYVNALNEEDHKIGKINDLDLSVSIAGKSLDGAFNINYERALSEQHGLTVRISTPEFVLGLPENAVALVDLDVYTKDPCCCQDFSSIMSWLNAAHDFEKKEFFSLFSNEILTQIRED